MCISCVRLAILCRWCPVVAALPQLETMDMCYAAFNTACRLQRRLARIAVSRLNPYAANCKYNASWSLQGASACRSTRLLVDCRPVALAECGGVSQQQERRTSTYVLPFTLFDVHSQNVQLHLLHLQLPAQCDSLCCCLHYTLLATEQQLEASASNAGASIFGKHVPM
jgi:hypothetical protein